MQKQLKKYFAFLFLFLLFFPMVEKQVHAFEHLNDIHCSSSDKHFHQQEHNCSICDYNSTDSNGVSDNTFRIFIAFVSNNYSAFSKSINTPSAFQDLPSRAPPVA